ncbi:MAG: S41 family peptidase [Bacteroidota bacterium]
MIFTRLSLIAFLLPLHLSAQEYNKFNLHFEDFEDGEVLPVGWGKWGGADLIPDTTVYYNGRASMLISAPEGTSFGACHYKIDEQYAGKQIALEGYIKTKDVMDGGFAGLMLRIDNDGQPLHFENMSNQHFNGTNDWKHFTVQAELPAEYSRLIAGGIMEGTGKAWFDDLKLTIDGVDIQELEPLAKELLPAELDTLFSNGPQFILNDLNDETTNRLVTLGKHWGFLKYHHPAISAGLYNWDNALFRVLPKLNDSDYKALLKQMVPNEDGEANAKYSAMGLDQIYRDIELMERDDQHYYVRMVEGIGNPLFRKELTYDEMNWEDDGLKLLALFRYWNMIEYFSPYKDVTDKKWDDVLFEYIPKMVEADDELSYKLTVIELIGELEDTHSAIIDKAGTIFDHFGDKSAPLSIKFVEGQPIIENTYNISETQSDQTIKVGDIITHINDIDVKEMIDQLVPYCPASNEATRLREIASKLNRTGADTIEFRLLDDSGIKTARLATVDHYSLYSLDRKDESHRMLGDNIGYIYPGSLKPGEIDEIMPKFMNATGIVVDMRSYPSDFIVFSMSKYLMPEPTEHVYFTKGSVENPGSFSKVGPYEVGESRPDYYKGKIVVLIDEVTQSQAEYTTMALRVAPQATVIGSQTAGADGDVSGIDLPGGIRTWISGIGVYYADGSPTQRIGIVPDIELLPTIKAIREGRDELLEKAIEVIEE